MCQHLLCSRQAARHHTLSDELVADQANDQVNELNNLDRIIHLLYYDTLLTLFHIASSQSINGTE